MRSTAGTPVVKLPQGNGHLFEEKEGDGGEEVCQKKLTTNDTKAVCTFDCAAIRDKRKDFADNVFR